MKNPPQTVFAPRHDLRRGSGWMSLSVLCFTANSLLLKYFASERGIDAWVSLTFRFGIGLLLTAAVFAPGGGMRLGHSFKNWLLASRGVLGGLSTAAFYLSIGPLGAGKAVLIGNTWTIFSAILAALVLHEALSAARLTGIVMALCGLGLLMGVGPGGFAQEWRWELVQLGGAILAAMVVVVIRELTRTETSATIFASQCVYGLILCVPFALPHLSALGGLDVLWLVVASVAAAAGQLAMTEGFRFLPVAAGGAFQVTLPLIISLGGVVLFEERFSGWQIFGGAMILLGSFQTIVRKG